MVKKRYYRNNSLAWAWFGIVWECTRLLDEIALSGTVFKRGVLSETVFKLKSPFYNTLFWLKKWLKKYYRNSGLGLAWDRIEVC